MIADQRHLDEPRAEDGIPQVRDAACTVTALSVREDVVPLTTSFAITGSATVH